MTNIHYWCRFLKLHGYCNGRVYTKDGLRSCDCPCHTISHD